MRLRYKAVTKDGKLSQGLLDAKDINETAGYLRARGLVPITITRIDNQFWTQLPFFNKVSNQDLILFTRQLSSMLTSGLTLMRGLEILKEQVKNQTMIEIITSIIGDVQEGKTLAGAIEKYPDVFNKIYVSIIQAGEKSGLLDKVLLRLADNLEKQSKLRSTIKSALMYPVIIIILMVGVIGIMMVVVLPQLSGLYQSLDVQLPITTLVVVGLSDFTVATWPMLIAGSVLLYVFYRRWSRTPDGSLIVDSIKLKLPIFGKLIEQSILAEFSRTLGLLVGTGTLVVDALMEAAETTGNVNYRNAIVAVSRQVEKGVSIGDALSVYPLFPSLLVQMVKIGEQTGKVDEALEKASEYFEREVDEKVKTLTTAMEPFIMIVLGVAVAFLILAVITPIYSLISSIQ
jgi:type IV pilus assembly protein PilC